MANIRKRFEIQGADTDPLEDYIEAKLRDSIHSIPTLFGFLFITFLIGFCAVVHRFEDKLPIPLNVSDEKAFPHSFIAERAQHDLRILTDIGPRVVGSYENEALAVEFLKREITIIQHMMHPNHKIQMDVQTVSGSYFFNFKPNGAINVYANVQNVVVKLFAQNHTQVSLLINAHFDSVPSSPGGSDDGINCVVMLEILRKLTRSPITFSHNIIFLFNGAEESGLQASHGFITQHKWAREVRGFINLDSGGAEGKEELFQVTEGSSWLIKYYKKVPYPRAQAIAQELFQSGVIPSDTDFRIFRDFGKAAGLDFAFVRNGYRYHTRFDGFANIQTGSYQHIGENILTLVRNLANAPELLKINSQSKGLVVYYDFLGLFLIAYSENAAFYLNIAVALLSLIVARKSLNDFGSGKSMKYVALTASAILLGWISSLVFVLITGFVLDVLKFTMSWYAHPWIILGLYIVPVVFCCAGSITFLRNSESNENWSISAHVQIQIHLIRMIWSILLLIGTLMGYRFVYAILIPVLFQTFAFIIIRILVLQHSVRKWQVIYILSTVIPTTFLIAQSIKFFYVIIPICGRFGSDKNPELYICILAYILSLLITSAYTPLITLLRKPSVILKILIGFFLVSLIFVFTPVGFPYSGNPVSPAPQRYMVFHTGRAFRNDSNEIFKRDAGFFVVNMDRNAPNKVKKHVKDIEKVKSIEDDCKEFLFCGLPVVTSQMIPSLHKSTWIPAGLPIIHESMFLQLNSKLVMTDSSIQFNFTISGPDRMVVYISPKPRVKLIATSLANKISMDPAIWNGRPIYTILFSSGLEKAPLTFTLDLQAPPNWNRPSLDLAVSVRYVHDKTHIKTPYFLKFLRDFPPWADVVGALGHYENWVF